MTSTNPSPHPSATVHVPCQFASATKRMGTKVKYVHSPGQGILNSARSLALLLSYATSTAVTQLVPLATTPPSAQSSSLPMVPDCPNNSAIPTSYTISAGPVHSSEITPPSGSLAGTLAHVLSAPAPQCLYSWPATPLPTSCCSVVGDRQHSCSTYDPRSLSGRLRSVLRCCKQTTIETPTQPRPTETASCPPAQHLRFVPPK